MLYDDRTNRNGYGNGRDSPTYGRTTLEPASGGSLFELVVLALGLLLFAYMIYKAF